MDRAFRLPRLNGVDSIPYARRFQDRQTKRLGCRSASHRHKSTIPGSSEGVKLEKKPPLVYAAACRQSSLWGHVAVVSRQPLSLSLVLATCLFGSLHGATRVRHLVSPLSPVRLRLLWRHTQLVPKKQEHSAALQ